MKSVTGFLLFLSVATPTTGQSCPGGWYHFGTSCYAFIDAEPLEWTEAMVFHTLAKNLAHIPYSLFLKDEEFRHAFNLKKKDLFILGEHRKFITKTIGMKVLAVFDLETYGTLHAKLVEIETAAENAFLKSHLTSLHTSDNYWIGLTDALVEGKFVWQTTQEDAVFVDWAPLEPNDLAHIEDCGDLHSGYHFKWNDASCSSKFDFICEREIEGNPANVIG